MITSEAQQEQERQAVFAACNRFLSGHGPEQPHEVLAGLAAAMSPAEEADRYGTGKLIKEFEVEIAGLLGKEAAVFLPSGTMAQQIALRVWCDRRGYRTIAFHPTCHLEVHEEKAYQSLHGLHGRPTGDPRRLLTLADLQEIATPYAALLLELPQREIGGELPSWDELQAQIACAHEQGAAVHMDGARLWDAGPFYGRTYADIAEGFDSVYVSFYKALGAIAGAALAGPADFIAQARVWQRRHGGTLFQLYPFVLSARLKLRQRLDRMATYYIRAQSVAALLRAVPGVRVRPDPPHTRMMHVYLPGDVETLQRAHLRIAREDRVLLFRHLIAAEVPGYSVFELAIGDAAQAISDAEVGALFTRLIGYQ